MHKIDITIFFLKAVVIIEESSTVPIQWFPSTKFWLCEQGAFIINETFLGQSRAISNCNLKICTHVKICIPLK